MEFSEIQDKVEFWLLDLPAGVAAEIPGWINEAVREACSRHNFRCMEAELLPVTQNQQRELETKPALWKEARSDPYMYRQDGSTKELNWAASESDMIRTYAIQLPDEGNTAAPDEGEPRYILERETTFDVFPLPDQLSTWDNGNYRIVIPYWAYLASLVSDNDTNWFTDDHPYYLIWKATAIGFAANRDEERAEYYSKKAEEKFFVARSQDKKSRISDRLSLAVHKDVYAGRPRSLYREG